MAKTAGGPWRNGDFMRLWAGQTVSQVGSQVTLLALPLVAVSTLHAGPAGLGLLTAAGRAPYLALGLLAGVWVDRWPRRTLLIVTNLGLAAVLSVVPASASAGELNLAGLCAVAFVAGALTVFLDIAYLSYVPSLVDPGQFTTAQGALETSQSLAQLGGPGLGGWLVQALTAPIAVLADAVSFLFPAVALLTIRRGATTRPPRHHASLGSQVRDGMRLVFGDPVLRAVTLCTMTFIFWFSAYSVVFILHLVHDLALPAWVLGLVFSAGAVGGLLGALLGPRVGRHVGLGRTLAGSLLVAATGAVLAPAVGRAGGLGLACAVVSQFVLWFGQQIYNVHQVPVRYALTPSAAHGRVNATIRFVVWGAAPLGSLLGGVLGAHLGLRGALLVAAGGSALGAAWIFGSPVRALPDLAELSDRAELAGVTR